MIDAVEQVKHYFFFLFLIEYMLKKDQQIITFCLTDVFHRARTLVVPMSNKKGTESTSE